MDRQAHWQEIYESKAETEVSWHQDHPAASLALIKDTGLPKDARIIDVGGGAARLVDHLIEEGWTNITVLDIAPAALDKARRRLGDRAALVTWLAADVVQWTPVSHIDLWR